MHRIDSEDTAVSIPTPDAVGGTVGYFRKGVPGAGTKATRFSADWCNAIQEELAGLIETEGLTLSKTDRTQVRQAIESMLLKVVPIGVVLPFDDFDGAVTFDPDHFKYADGSVVSDVDSPLNGKTLRDMSGRYLVGLGTDGGGNIDSVAWSAGPVGNAAHQVNLAHTHTGPSHTHTGPSHTHTSDAHSHTLSTAGWAQIYVRPSTNEWIYVNHVAATQWNPDGFGACDHRSDDGYSPSYGVALDGSTDSATPGATGASGTGATGASGTGATGSGGSATQSIQPRSIPVRFIVRYK